MIVFEKNSKYLICLKEATNLQRLSQKKIKVNICAALKRNNGIKGICDSNENKTFQGNKIVCVTGGDGGSGLAYYQRVPFSISSSTCVLTPNFNMTENTGIFIADQLSQYKKVYNYGGGWSISRMKNDKIILPWKNNEIDYEFIDSLF